MRPVTPVPPDSIATRFAQIMTGLRAALAAAYGRPVLAGGGMDRPRRPLAPPLVLRLHRRLGAMMLAFAALVAHLTEFGADAPPRAPRRKRAPRPDAAAPIPEDAAQDPSHWAAAAAAAAIAATPGAARPSPPPRAPRPPRLPGNYGWLPGVSCGVAAAASQLRHLLTDPELLAVLHTSPALVQMLRPLCWMLGVDLPATVLPPRPARAAAETPAPPPPSPVAPAVAPVRHAAAGAHGHDFEFAPESAPGNARPNCCGITTRGPTARKRERLPAASPNAPAGIPFSYQARRDLDAIDPPRPARRRTNAPSQSDHTLIAGVRDDVGQADACNAMALKIVARRVIAERRAGPGAAGVPEIPTEGSNVIAPTPVADGALAATAARAVVPPEPVVALCATAGPATPSQEAPRSPPRSEQFSCHRPCHSRQNHSRRPRPTIRLQHARCPPCVHPPRIG